jgi:DNA-binding beta-propeller fold protein YncE
VSDAERNDVQRFTREGAYVETLSPGTAGEEFKAPALIGIDEEGTVYVPDVTRIHVFGADGQFERTIKTTEVDNGEVAVGFDAAATSGGYLFVSDVQRERVAVFDAEGRAIGSFGERGTGAGQFDEIGGLTLDGNGTLYVLDFANHRIQAFRLLLPDPATPVASP